MLVWPLALSTAILAISTALLARRVARVHSEKNGKPILGTWPIPMIDLEAFDPRFQASALGPGLETEVAFIAGYRVPGGTSDLETWILANLAKEAKTIFEFGTCTGKTTYLFARNAPADARVITLTLPRDGLGAYREAPGDDPAAKQAALEESRYARFYYSGTPVEAKVRQLLGDSKAFDESPYLGRFDLIFVDGSHAYSYVKSDTEKALRMLRPGGIVLWHDYRGPRRAKGVFRALNELAKDLPLVRLKGTTLVAYRAPS